MIQIIVQAQKASCRKSSGERITTGMVGKHVSFDFSAEWDGLVKTAVFEGSGVKKDVTLSGDTAVIPHECLTVPGGMLRVGVFGTDGTTQTPTVYTDIGQIEQGADPSGDTSADHTLPIWAQLQAMMGDLSNLTTTARDNLVAAINEAAKSGGGGGAAADVRMQVAGGYIQYSSDGGANWNNLIAVAELIGPTDETLTESGQAADAKATGDAIRSLSEEIANLQTSGLTTEQVNALDGMFKVCAFSKDNVSAEYTAFKTAFGITDSGGETEVTLTSISVTYDGGDVPVGTAVTDLTGIVVTAHYSDGSTAEVTGYTLSGEIAEGSNTIIVTYNGKTATFTVTGTVENERVEHIVSGQTFPVTLTWSPVVFDVTPALATHPGGPVSIYYDVEIDVESISSENAYIMVTVGSGAFVRNASDYAGQTGTLKMTGEVWHSTMSNASQIKISCNKGTETSNQTAVITGVRIYER